MAGNLNFTGVNKTTAAEQIEKLYNLFIAVDATQVEINPFGETPDGEVVCFDAKINCKFVFIFFIFVDSYKLMIMPPTDKKKFSQWVIPRSQILVKLMQNNLD